MMSLPPVLAHPVMEPGGLPVPPVVVATAAAAVLVVAARIPMRECPPPPSAVDGSPLEPPGGAPLPLWAFTRLVGVVLLVLAVAGGRLRNAPLAPTLVVSVAWPLLLVASGGLGQVWRWVNPFDTLGRLVHRSAAEPERAPSVWWAAAPALAWVSYLHVNAEPFHPRTVAVALANYTFVVLVGCLVMGRHRWLLRAEVFGLLFTWVGLLRRGGLLAWRPPAGADLVLGVLAGGLLFGGIRASTLWPLLPSTPWVRWYPLIGLLVAAGTGALVVSLTERWARRLGAPGSVTAAVVPMVAVTGIATGLEDGRLLVGLQRLPRLLTDPFHLGWDPIGAASWPIHPQPLGMEGHVALQVLLMVAGAVTGVRVARARAGDRRAGDPATVVLGVVLAVGTIVLTAV